MPRTPPPDATAEHSGAPSLPRGRGPGRSSHSPRPPCTPTLLRKVTDVTRFAASSLVTSRDAALPAQHSPGSVFAAGMPQKEAGQKAKHGTNRKAANVRGPRPAPEGHPGGLSAAVTMEHSCEASSALTPTEPGALAARPSSSAPAGRHAPAPSEAARPCDGGRGARVPLRGRARPVRGDGAGGCPGAPGSSGLSVPPARGEGFAGSLR